jgi:two-component system chemotaxis response regulator CheY
MKFLVADDSSMVRNYIEQLLRKMGAMRVDKCADGKEALLKIRKSYTESNPYSLLTLDWEMPEMSGLDLLKLLKEDPKMKELPVLMISSQGSQQSIELVIPIQPSGYIVKPFSDETFIKKIIALYPKLK